MTDNADDRAAVLRKAADHLAALRPCDECDPGRHDAIERLRRLADEAQQPKTRTSWTPGPVALARAAEWASQHRAATIDPAMCPRCKGDNSEAFALCDRCTDEPVPSGVVVEAGDNQAECTASISGNCLREGEGDTACDTEAGECVHEGLPVEETGAALARHIADQPMSTIMGAFRILGWPPLRFGVENTEGPS